MRMLLEPSATITRLLMSLNMGGRSWMGNSPITTIYQASGYRLHMIGWMNQLASQRGSASIPQIPVKTPLSKACNEQSALGESQLGLISLAVVGPTQIFQEDRS